MKQAQTQNIKRISGLVMIVFVFFLVSLPVFAYAQNVVEDTGIVYDCANESNTLRRPGECTFQDLLNAVRRVTNYAMVFTLSLSVVVIAYAGYNYMVSGDNAGKRKEANEMLRKVVIGIVLIMAAWLIVRLITSALLNSNIIFGV